MTTNKTKTTGLLIGALFVFGLMSGVSPSTAQTFIPSNHASFTLEGCRNNGTIVLPDGSGQFICPDPAYTTGNLGKGWNELDVVPHRLITQLGNQSAATTDYNVYIAADDQKIATGYDVLSVPVVNATMSDASCAISASGIQYAGSATDPFGGGVDVVAYRELTIHQNKGTTCVFDYVIRLALGAHLFSGSSLQSYMFDGENLSGSKKTISIPVNEILPQELSKNMTASQGVDYVWDITKSPHAAILNFGDTCLPEGVFSKPVNITINWEIQEADPTNVTVITKVYATNPASREITVNVTDKIYEGCTDIPPTTPGTLLHEASGSYDVPANTTQLVLSHNYSAPSDATNLCDVATATYTDKVTGFPVPGQTEARMYAPVQVTATNLTATITDTEEIAGEGLSFSVNNVTVDPSYSWAFSGYTLGDHTLGPVLWGTTGLQIACNPPFPCDVGSVVFGKMVYLDGRRITSGTLSDTASLLGSSGFSHSDTASVAILSDAKVNLTINKTIPDPTILDGEEILTFNFDVCESDELGNCLGGGYAATATITFSAGDPASKSMTINSLAPGYYKVSEQLVTGFQPANNPQTVNINLPTCAATLSFDNTTPTQAFARAQVQKQTVPAGSEAGWSFKLSSTKPGCVVNETATTTGTEFVMFNEVLKNNCEYIITETLKPGWGDSPATSGECTFTVNYPGDFEKVFECTYTNTRAGKDLAVSKTATGTFNRTYFWVISKDVDKTTVNIAAGGMATFNYTVNVGQTDVTDAGWVVNGKITVTNPNDWEDITLTGLSDTVDNGGTCTLSPAGPYVVPKGGSLDVDYSCSYASKPSSYSGTNTATATWNKAAAFTPNDSATGSKAFTLTQAGSTNKTVHVTDTYGGNLGSVTGTDTPPFATASFKYSHDFAGVGGTCTNYNNTATITETNQSSSQTVKVCVGLDLTVTKTAAGTFDRTYLWQISKGVDNTLVNIAAGGTATFNYTVKVDETGVSDAGWTLGGNITVNNPNDWEAITVNVTDLVSNGGACAVTGGTGITIPASSWKTFAYTCSYVSAPSAYSGTNTGTAAWNKTTYFTPNDTAMGTKTFTLSESGSTNKTVTVTDTLGGNLGTVTGTDSAPFAAATFNYSHNFAGVGGTCTNYDNTAKITETNQSDSQTVNVCVGLDVAVTKTATGIFNRTYLWDISKDVDKTLVKIHDEISTATFNYTAKLDQTGISDSGWIVSGKITMSNPNDWEAITLTGLSDVVDNGGTCTIIPGPYIIPKSGSLVVDYSCNYASTPSSYSGTNTGTATWNKTTYFTPNGSASGSAPFTQIQLGSTNKTVNVTDTLGGDLGTVTGTDSAPFATAAFTYSHEFPNILGCMNYDNTAKIIETGDTASRTVEVCVEWSHVTVLKLTQGVESPSDIWTFNLYNGPHANDTSSAFLGSPVVSDSTPPPLINFNNYYLDPENTYTVCEMGVPAAWTSMWQVYRGGQWVIVNPYNPNAKDSPSQDFGNRCFDFGAFTTYTLTSGATLEFKVDNTYPGGEPRTPGFWKNWNTCTGGNQDETAAKNSTPELPWYILDDLLNNPGFTIGLLTLGGGQCQQAVYILDKSDLFGKKKSSDAAYNLATALFAAELNLAAGAETCEKVTDAVSDAQNLLASIKFNGKGDYLGSKVKGSLLTLRNQALTLANTLDMYNNGKLCP